MLRNLSKTLLMAAAAWLAAASALSAQQPGGDPLRGDVNGDGAVTAADARIVADYLVGKPVPAGANVAARGDVNGDGRVTSVDAAIIAGFAAGRANVDRFKVGLPVGELPANTLARMVCTANVRAGSVSCGEPASTPDGLRATEMYTGGPNGTYVKLTSFDVVPADAEGNFKFKVTVENRLPQRLGTQEDGVTPHADGVRVFFDLPPTAVGPGGGEIQVMGAQTGTFVGGNKPYYAYAAPLQPGATSEAVQWHFKLAPSVTEFQFSVYVWAHGLPGWIDITPPAHAPSPYTVPVNYLVPGDSLDVTGTVRNSFGVALGTPVGSWTSSNPAIATVSSTGSHTARIKAVAEGVDTVTASSMPSASVSSNARIGRTQVVVTYGDTALSTITALPASLPVGDSATVTVQAKFPDGTNAPRGGGTVLLSATGGATVTAVTDNGNGTYTAKVTSTTAGAVTVSGTLNGHTIVATASVTFTAGTPSGMAANSSTSQSATVGTAVAAPPSVKVTDAHGNAVAGVVVTFTVSTGGGQVSNGVDPAGSSATATTDASGVATLTSWTLGTTAGTDNNTVTASATGLTDVVFTASGTAGAAASMAAGSATTQSATVATAVSAPPSVTVTDAHGNPVSGFVVTFTVNSGGGTVSNGTDPAGSSATVTTNASGVATLSSWTLGTTAGTDNNTVSASGTGVTSVNFTASGSAGAAANMAAASATTQSAEVGTAVSAPPSVTVTDAHGNVVSGFSVTFTVSAGGGTVSNGTDPAGASATVTTNASGVATLTSWTVGNTVGTDNNTVTASGTGVSDVSFNASGTPGAVHHFVIGTIGDQLAGAPFNVQVTAQDQFNNTATGFTGTVDFTTTPSGGITAGGTSAAFTAGVLSSHSITIGTAGDYTLTATRSGGTEAGTSNQFQVQQAPTAAADAPTASSAPGDPWHAAFNSALAATNNVLANDTRGLPLATVTSFGGGDLGGTVTSNTAGEAVTPLPGHASGSLSVAADGSVAFTPPTGFTGLYTFQYRITNVRGTSDAQVTIAVGVRPAVTNDSYSTNLLGNVPINTATSTGFNVTTNDQGDAKVLALVGATGGTATLAPGGTFSFRPNAGHTGAASFTYTVTNGFGTTAAATVSMNVSGIAWFVDRDAASNGDGRFDAPFNDLSAAYAAGTKPQASQPVFLYSSGTSYTGGVTLLAGQRLVGEGATGTSFADVMGVTWPADAGTQPSIGGTRPTVGTNLTLGNGNTLQGFNLGGSGTLIGTGFGTLTVSEVGINTTGQALNLNNGTLAGAGFTQVRSTGGTNNVSLTNVATSGTPALGTNADALSGATGSAFVINGGNGSFTYAGTIANTSLLAVDVSNKSGGTVTFSGDINPVTAARGISVASNTGGTVVNFSGTNQKISSGTATGVSLTNNGSSGGATVNFTGGNLVISTTSGSGFVATGGGTVSVNGGANNNTINVTAGSGSVALNVQNTAIAGGVLNFKSISATGGTSGIVLSNTSGGGLTVPGDGASDLGNTTRGRTTAKSGGGTVGLTSGGTISSTSGDGIALNTTGAVTLRNMVVQNGSADGIDASTVTGLVLDNLLVTGHTGNRGVFANGVSGLKIFHSQISGNATTAAAGGASLYNLQLADVTGTDSIMSSQLHTAHSFVMYVANNTGTLNLRVENTQITGATNGMAAGIYPGGSSNVTANFQNDSIGHSSSRGLQSGTTTGSSAVYNLTVNNTAFRNNFVAIDNAHGSSGTYTFNITNNNLQTNVASSAQAINVNRLGSPSFSNYGLYSGTISGNTIGTAATANSGSDVGDGINVESNGSGGITRVAVLNNVIRQVGQRGIYVAAVDTDIGGGVAPTLEARVQGNNIANLEATALDGIQSLLGALSTDNPIICLNISGNTVSAAPRNGIRVRTSGLPSSTPTLRLHGWDGVTAPATYFANLNPAATGATANVNYSLGGGTASSASCTTP